MRVLLTGMSGTGKSTLVAELRRRGVLAYDADEDGFSEPRDAGRWGWRRAAVADLLERHTEGLLCFAGLEETRRSTYRILLTAPEAVLIERLRARTQPLRAHGRRARADPRRPRRDRAAAAPDGRPHPGEHGLSRATRRRRAQQRWAFFAPGAWHSDSSRGRCERRIVKRLTMVIAPGLEMVTVRTAPGLSRRFR